MQSALPPPIEFTATVEEVERVYASLVPKARVRVWLAGVQGVGWSALAVMNFDLGGHSYVVGWLSVILAGCYFFDVLRQIKVNHDERRILASISSIRVAFSNAALEVAGDEREPRSVRTIALRSVRSVRIVADALVVLTSAGSSRPALIVPLRALHDGGDAVMRYFDDRIVAKRMLHRGSDSRTTLVNTALR